MHIITILGQKGGTGKTTLAVGLAVSAVLNGAKALILDLDPQANATHWNERRPPDDNLHVSSVQPGVITKALQAAAETGFDWVIIDTPGKSESASIAAARVADLVLVPCQNSVFAAETLSGVRDILNIAGNPDSFVVLNQLHPSIKNPYEDNAPAIERVYGFKTAPHVLTQRAAYSAAPAAGRSAQELDPTGKAAEELGGLFRFAESEIFNNANQKVRA